MSGDEECIPIHVVALGASNTAGYGVGTEYAYPAVLERLLRNRGVDTIISNAGVSGDTTGEMLARLDRAVPSGTRLVIFQPGSNDVRRGLGEEVREANIGVIQSRLSARHIGVVRVATAFASPLAGHLQGDGIHFTKAGHARIANRLFYRVFVALNSPATLHAREADRP
jgi:acyl-CoA thioesterase I